ncbi:Ethylene-responsive transcription factor [Capsicum chinense]|nr:Ethylene-responsive transcription factor [Capsicum chinense]
METDEQGLLADENEEETSCKKQKITQIVVDKVKFTIPLEHTNHKAQTTSVATERSKETDSKMALFGNEWQNMGTFLGSEEFKGFSSNMHKFQGKETSCIMSNVHGIESFGECNTSISSGKGKISLIGIRRQKTGRYGAVIRDTIRRKQVWLGTFDTVEEASQAYFNKKLELENEKLNQQGNKEDRPEENCDQIQQPESPVVQCLSMANDQTSDTACVNRINSHETTRIVEVHKNKMSGEEPGSSKETACGMASVRGTESSVECNTSTSCNSKGEISLIGVRRQKNGRYGAVIRDTIRRKQVWLGTFDTVEEASLAYFSKKLELENENLNQQGNKESKSKENIDQIQQPESPSVQCLSVGNDQIQPPESPSVQCLSVANDPIQQPESPSLQCLSVADDQIQQPESPGAQCLSVANDQIQQPESHRVRCLSVANDQIQQPESPGMQCLSVGNDQIQPPESSSVRCLSVANNQTLDTASVSRINSHITTTHTLGVHKKNWSGKEQEFSKVTSCLMANVQGTESSNECSTTTSCLPTEKRSLLGIRRQKNGRYGAVITDKRSLLGIRRQKTGKYGAVITDKIRHKQIWLGTFDTVEEASQAYFSKKFEFEKLSQQDNKDNKPKENLDQIQQPESSVMQCLSMAIDPTLDTAGVNRINPHETTHIVEVHKNNMSGKEPGSSKETPCLMASVHGTESSAECNTSTSCNPTGKISLVGVRRQKNGRYGAVVRDKIRRKQIWLGTFDTVEEASQAYFSKKSELEKKKLNQQRNKDNRSKKNGDRIQQPGSPVVLASLSVTDVQAFDTASVGMRNERIDFHKTTHIVGVHKSKTAGKEPESSKETSCLMDNVHDTESYDEGNTTTSRDPTAKRSLRGIRRQKSGRYGAVITDRIKHKKVWLGTFDTVEEASQAYLSKKSELKKLERQSDKEDKPKKNCDQVQQPESHVVASFPVANHDQTLNAARVDRRYKGFDPHETETRYFRVHKRKGSGKYTTEIRNPISKKRIWLGTFNTAEEASRVYQSNKLEFQKLVHAKRQCSNEQTFSKQDGKSEKLVNIKQGHENVDSELESAGGSEIVVQVSNSSNGGTEQRIDSHEIGTCEEAFYGYLSNKFDLQISNKVELQSNMPTDSSAREEKQEGQEDDEDLWMGEWVQLPGNRAVKFSQKLGLPIIDNYGSLLGEFSTLDDLSICKTEDGNET